MLARWSSCTSNRRTAGRRRSHPDRSRAHPVRGLLDWYIQVMPMSTERFKIGCGTHTQVRSGFQRADRPPPVFGVVIHRAPIVVTRFAWHGASLTVRVSWPECWLGRSEPPGESGDSVSSCAAFRSQIRSQARGVALTSELWTRRGGSVFDPCRHLSTNPWTLAVGHAGVVFHVPQTDRALFWVMSEPVAVSRSAVGLVAAGQRRSAVPACFTKTRVFASISPGSVPKFVPNTASRKCSRLGGRSSSVDALEKSSSLWASVSARSLAATASQCSTWVSGVAAIGVSCSLPRWRTNGERAATKLRVQQGMRVAR